jgi:hypothetical protein
MPANFTQPQILSKLIFWCKALSREDEGIGAGIGWIEEEMELLEVQVCTINQFRCIHSNNTSQKQELQTPKLA